MPTSGWEWHAHTQVISPRGWPAWASHNLVPPSLGCAGALLTVTCRVVRTQPARALFFTPVIQSSHPSPITSLLVRKPPGPWWTVSAPRSAWALVSWTGSCMGLSCLLLGGPGLSISPQHPSPSPAVLAGIAMPKLPPSFFSQPVSQRKLSHKRIPPVRNHSSIAPTDLGKTLRRTTGQRMAQEREFLWFRMSVTGWQSLGFGDAQHKIEKETGASERTAK